MNDSIYVGCSLTDAPPGFVRQVERFKKLLRQEGYKVIDFLGTTLGDAAMVYCRDIKECIPECNLFVAICDYPATGLGYEMGTAVEKYGKLVLAVAKEGRKISRLPQGVDHPNYTFRRYRELEEVVGMVCEILPPALRGRIPSVV